jgi:nucleotide-binding universal stress UspA family protein
MIKDMLVNLALNVDRDPAADFSIATASVFNAHIAAIGYIYQPNMPLAIGAGEVYLPWVDELRAENEERAEAAAVRFEEAVRRAGVSAETQLLDPRTAGAPDLFGQMARRFDLAIVQQPTAASLGMENMFIEAALFDSGRPVLVVPHVQAGELRLNRVLVCWDGSRNAARAIGDAMPFLKHAKTIEVLTVGKGVKSDEIAGADIAHHLARHDLRVQFEQIVAPQEDVPTTILSHVADSATDLVVMGAYGHSRLREFVLGGATRGILFSMTVPTLMSH